MLRNESLDARIRRYDEVAKRYQLAAMLMSLPRGTETERDTLQSQDTQEIGLINTCRNKR